MNKYVEKIYFKSESLIIDSFRGIPNNVKLFEWMKLLEIYVFVKLKQMLNCEEEEYNDKNDVNTDIFPFVI